MSSQPAPALPAVRHFAAGQLAPAAAACATRPIRGRGAGRRAGAREEEPPPSACAGHGARGPSRSATQAPKRLPLPKPPPATAPRKRLDYAAIYGGGLTRSPMPPCRRRCRCRSLRPWETWNRKVRRFNDVVDRNVAQPLARAYPAAVPRPVRLGVTNFFNNLGQPLTALNALLQNRSRSTRTGAGPVPAQLDHRHRRHLRPGQRRRHPQRSGTSARRSACGAGRLRATSRLPLFGPAHPARDTFGRSATRRLSPIRQVEDNRTRYFLQGLQLVNLRATVRRGRDARRRHRRLCAGARCLAAAAQLLRSTATTAGSPTTTATCPTTCSRTKRTPPCPPT